MAQSRRGVVAGAVAAALMAVTAVACQNGDGGDAQPSPTTSSPRTASPGPTVTSPPVSPSPEPSSPTATPSPGAGTRAAQVRAAWAAFFDPDASVQEKVARVEDGRQYALMIRGFVVDERAARLRVQVESVTFTSPREAKVGYRVFLEEEPLPRGRPGTAVLQDGTWKLSFQTVCALAGYGGDVPRAGTC